MEVLQEGSTKQSLNELLFWMIGLRISQPVWLCWLKNSASCSLKKVTPPSPQYQKYLVMPAQVYLYIENGLCHEVMVLHRVFVNPLLFYYFIRWFLFFFGLFMLELKRTLTDDAGNSPTVDHVMSVATSCSYGECIAVWPIIAWGKFWYGGHSKLGSTVLLRLYALLWGWPCDLFYRAVP